MMKPPTRHAGICYLEIPAPSLEKAQVFYSAVFGWDMKPSEGYLSFKTGMLGFEGGFDPKLPVGEGGVVIYVEVKDIPAALKAVKEAGGTVLQDKTGIGEHGFVGFFRDPNGNRIGLWSKA